MNALAPIGHNCPPDPIDEATAPYQSAIEEAANWLDGTAVENEGQMKAVDAIAKQIRAARSDLEKAKKSATAPLHDAWKAELARWKPTEDDLDRIQRGLASLVDGFKRKLAAEKAEAKRKADAEAWAARRAAEDAARAANAADLEAQRAAAEAQREAEEAQRRAAAASKDKVTGLRTVTRYEITDPRDLLNWLARNRKDDVLAFIEEWARRNHKPDPGAAGLRVWTEQEAF